MASGKIVTMSKNDLSGYTDVSSYKTTPYVFPSDGYIIASCGDAPQAKAIIRVYGSGGTNSFTVGGWGNSTYSSYPCFVKAGMKCQVVTLENNGWVRFFSIE